MRKVKILRVCNRLILEVFQNSIGQSNIREYYSNLPKDTKIVSVHSNYERATFDFLISSKTFEEVPEGVVPPIFEYNEFVTSDVNKNWIKKWLMG